MHCVVCTSCARHGTDDAVRLSDESYFLSLAFVVPSVNMTCLTCFGTGCDSDYVTVSVSSLYTVFCTLVTCT